MAKQLKQFYIEPEQVKFLEDQAKRTGDSQAKIIRKLIKEKMKARED